MKLISSKKKLKAFSIVEIILSISILSIVSTAIVYGLLEAQDTTLVAGRYERAVDKAEEGFEAVRNIRDEDFSNLIDGTYGLAVAGDEWTFSGTSDTDGIYTREVIVSTVDIDTKQIDVNVDWQQNAQRAGDVSFTSYLTNWSETQSTSNLSIDLEPVDDVLLYLYGRYSNYGQFNYLVNGPAGNSLLRFDLTAIPQVNINVLSAQLRMTAAFSDGDTNAISVHNILPGNNGWVEGSGTGGWAGTGEPSYYFKDSGSPIYWAGSYGANSAGTDYVATAMDSVSGPWNANTNYTWDLDPAVVQTWFDNAADNHGLTTRNDTGAFKYFFSGEWPTSTQRPVLTVEYEEVIVAQDWNLPLTESTLDIQDNNDGYKIDYQGDYAYMVRNRGNPDFIVINITDTDSPVIADTLSLSGSPRNIKVSGNYAYVVSSSNNAEFQIINISNPNNVSVSSTENLSDKNDALGIDVVGNYAYFTRAKGAHEFGIIDITNKNNPNVVGIIDLDSTAYEVKVIGNYAYMASSENSEELYTINISNPSSPSVNNTYDAPGNNNALTVDAVGNTLLIGRDNGQMIVFDRSTPNNPSAIATYNGVGPYNDIEIGGQSNDYAFIATSSGSSEFQVIDISTPSSPSLYGFLNSFSTLYGVTYDSSRDRVYSVGKDNSNEFIIFEPSF